MWLALPALLAVQGPKLAQARLSDPRPIVRVPRLTPAARRDLLTRSLAGTKITTDLSETLVLDFRSDPPQNAWLAAYRPAAFLPADGGEAVFERSSAYDASRGELAVGFPVTKGSAYAIVVVGASGCGSVEGTIAVGKGTKANVAAPVPSGSDSFVLAFSAGTAGKARLVLWPKPEEPVKDDGSVTMKPPKKNDFLVVQRVEITRIN